MNSTFRRCLADTLALCRAASWRALLSGALIWGGAQAHAGSYQVVDLGGTKHGVDTQVAGLNRHGVVVGSAGAREAPHLQHPVRFSVRGHATDLAVQDGLPGVRGGAVAINSRGQTAGWIEPAFGQDVVAFIEHHGTMTLLPSPSGEFPTVRAINDRGQVVGNVWAVEDACFGQCAFIIRDGQWTILPSLTRGQLSYAYAINNNGLIVGISFQGTNHQRPIKAVMWRNGRIRALPGMEHLFASAYGVNDSGEVVGAYHLDSGQQHAFLWRDGVLVDLDGRADSESRAWAVNGSGQVIGERLIGSHHGSFVTIDGAMQWLDDLLLPGPDGLWHLGEVRGINDAGQIAGTAQDGKGEWRAVRLDPVTR